MKIDRKERNKYPAHIEHRVPELRKLVRGQITKYGFDPSDLYWMIGSDSKTTLVNRIHKGTLTLKDMLWISDFLPDVDWNFVIQRLREDRAILDKPVAPSELSVSDDAVRNFLGDFPGL